MLDFNIFANAPLSPEETRDQVNALVKFCQPKWSPSVSLLYVRFGAPNHYTMMLHTRM
jgi:hypothetical protein